MKTAKLLMLMFVILFAYGFTINHFVADNGNSPFPESLNKRVSNSNLYRYLAFSNWMEKIESKKTTSDDNAIDQDWYSTVIENIKKEEYNITYIEKVFSYQSPNRANNYRFKYFKDGFSVSPMLTKIPLFDESDMTIKEKNKKYKNIKDWKITMRLHSFGKNGNLKTFNGDILTADKNTAFIEDNNLKIKYENKEEGMRQDFVIKQKSEGEGFLKLHIGIRTKLKVIIGTNGVVFKESSGNEVLKYNGLKIWDSEGKELKGWFEKSDNKSFYIVVNDENAVYPITVDPLSATANWTAEGNYGSAYFGCSVSSAGDVNKDGYSDVIVGAWNYWSGVDYGAAYVFHGSATGLSTTAEWSTFGTVAGIKLGYSVSSAGDVNGDGYSDVIIGVPGYTNGENYEGAAYVYHGYATGLSTTADRIVESNQASANFGCSVSSAGDVNGDGYSDVIVGADLYDNGLNAEGMAYVYHGSSFGLSTTADWTFESDQYQARFGYSVSNAGDINGDGYSDIIVGAYACNYNGNNAGRVYVFNGSSDGLSTIADWIKEGSAASTNFGNSVSTAGDVNGDGYSDVIVGAEGYDNGQYNEGKVYVYHGSSSGLSSTADWSVESNKASANFGSSVSIAGDVNGDGFSDVIVGAQFYENGENNEGMAFVYFGSSSGLSPSANWVSESNQAGASLGNSVSSAGDVNGDGYSDVIVGAHYYDNGYINEGGAFVYHGFVGGLSSIHSWQLDGVEANAHLGFSVSTAGDVNGDGYSDVIIGAHGMNIPIGWSLGNVYVYYGSSNGLNVTPDWTYGHSEPTEFGYSVSTAGDVNGDGFSDIIVGARCGSDNHKGTAYVFYGSNSGLSTSPNWAACSNQYFAYFGNSVSTAGDINGDGYSDVIIGAYEYINTYEDEGMVFVWYGSASGLGATGNPSNADWTGEVIQAGARYGNSVSTAGDVNGDGFSDIIVGACDFDAIGKVNGGKVFVYYGSASGLSETSNWSAEGEYGYGSFGYSVSNAGDVNGDGFSDVIIGAKGDYKAYVYHGSSNGLNSTPNWTAESSQSLCYFGGSVSTAGDINGDGYSDVIVGAYGYDNDQENEGRAFLYLGSSGGLNTETSWTAESNQEDASFGIGVSTAGDVNGDGYSDVIAGACNFNSVYPNQGRAFFYYGNNGDCVDLSPLQWRHDLYKLIVPPLKSLADDRVKLEMLGKSFFGRTKVKIQFEVRPLGTPFGSGKGEGITETYSWQDIETAGVRIPWYITGLTDRTMYKWRMRIKYDPSDAPPQPYSRWVYNVTSPNGPAVSSLQVSDDDNPLPVSFLSFTSQVEKNDVILKWSTLNESNNQGFRIERKIVNDIGRDWIEVGFVRGNGTSNQIHDYQFTDKNLQKGRYLYRLKQVDYNNNFGHHYLGAPVSIGVPAKFELGQNYPNSFNPTTKIDFALPTDSRISLKVYDITGRLITILINNEYRTTDYYTIEFNGSSFASGVYFYRLITEKNIMTKKMVLLK